MIHAHGGYNMDENSILLTVKHMLGGVVSEESYFDLDLINHINSSFFKLWQLGIGPQDAPFKIEDSFDDWEDFECEDMEMVKEWVYLDVKKVFDPPSNSSVLQAIKDKAYEDEFRMQIAAEERDGKYSNE